MSKPYLYMQSLIVEFGIFQLPSRFCNVLCPDGRVRD